MANVHQCTCSCAWYVGVCCLPFFCIDIVIHKHVEHFTPTKISWTSRDFWNYLCRLPSSHNLCHLQPWFLSAVVLCYYLFITTDTKPNKPNPAKPNKSTIISTIINRATACKTASSVFLTIKSYRHLLHACMQCD